jgi:hypothetical protein
MMTKREPHPTEKGGDEKFYENRQKSRGKKQGDFRPDLENKGPPEPQRRREELKK